MSHTHFKRLWWMWIFSGVHIAYLTFINETIWVHSAGLTGTVRQEDSFSVYSTVLSGCNFFFFDLPVNSSEFFENDEDKNPDYWYYGYNGHQWGKSGIICRFRKWFWCFSNFLDKGFGGLWLNWYTGPSRWLNFLSPIGCKSSVWQGDRKEGKVLALCPIDNLSVLTFQHRGRQAQPRSCIQLIQFYIRRLCMMLVDDWTWYCKFYLGGGNDTTACRKDVDVLIYGHVHWADSSWRGCNLLSSEDSAG